jgi:hypothetical protein
MERERQIIKYENVLYLGKAHDGDAFTISISQSDPPLVYVEGYIKLKPGNLKKRHSWVFDPAIQTAYEVAQLDSLKDLGLKNLEHLEKIPWESIEYYGYEVTPDEIAAKKQAPFALSDSALEPIRQKIK